jgi:hypothetical protein
MPGKAAPADRAKMRRARTFDEGTAAFGGCRPTLRAVSLSRPPESWGTTSKAALPLALPLPFFPFFLFRPAASSAPPISAPLISSVSSSSLRPSLDVPRAHVKFT